LIEISKIVEKFGQILSMEKERLMLGITPVLKGGEDFQHFSSITHSPLSMNEISQYFSKK